MQDDVERLVWEHLRVDKGKVERIASLKQGTAEWLASRVLRLTVSNAGTVCGNNPYCKAAEYARELAGLAPPLDPESYDGKRRAAALQWGHDHEDKACEAYEMMFGCAVAHCGLVVDLERPWMGASPDGMVDEDGLLEIKCPVTQRIYTTMPPYYYDQIMAQMAVLGKKWCDFVVWTPSDMCVWRFDFNEPYWREFLLPRLEAFYHDAFLPLYVDAVVAGAALPPAEMVKRRLAEPPRC